MDKDAYYFPHFCNARHDRKIMRLRKELGVEGYGIFFMLLEILREQIDFKYPMTDMDLLADEFGCSEQKLRVVICNYQLFEVDPKEQFFSPKLLVYLEPYLNMKEQRRIAGKKSGEARRLKQADCEQPLNNRSATVEQPLNENEQKKVKETKVNESKEDIKAKPIKNKYADRVFMLVEEYDKLVAQYSKDIIDNKIIDLDLWKGSKGKATKSDYLTILAWLRKDKPILETTVPKKLKW